MTSDQPSLDESTPAAAGTVVSAPRTPSPPSVDGDTSASIVPSSHLLLMPRGGGSAHLYAPALKLIQPKRTVVVQPAPAAAKTIGGTKAGSARKDALKETVAVAAPEDDDGDEEEGDGDTDSLASDEDEDEASDDELSDEDALDDDGPSPADKPSSPAFVPFCPLPLLFCLTLVGGTFVLAGVLLLFGVESWGVREEALEKYNRFVDEWTRTGQAQMHQAGFSVLELVKRRTDEARVIESNQTAPLTPVFVESVDVGLRDTEATIADETTTTDQPPQPSSVWSVNGLHDRGDDVRTYSALRYELLMPSPISWDSSDDVDRYWRNLLNHDSRTLYLQSTYDNRANSKFNLTIPFIQKESQHGLTKHACEETKSGMYDHETQACTFFSQLHAICLRMRLLDDAPSTPPASRRLLERKHMSTSFDDGPSPSPSNPLWSFDTHPLGFDLMEATPASRLAAEILPTAAAGREVPQTSLLVLPPIAHTPEANLTRRPVVSPATYTGCIWDSTTTPGSWKVGAYHAVDIRSEHFISRFPEQVVDVPAAGETSAEDGPHAGGDADAGQRAQRLLRQQQAAELTNMLRVTIRHAGDPYLLALQLTDGVLWFGLARTEKILLSVVLASLGLLFLIAPTVSLTAYLKHRTKAFYARSRRARKGGYASVTRASLASPQSPNGDVLIEMTNGRAHPTSPMSPGGAGVSFIPGVSIGSLVKGSHGYATTPTNGNHTRTAERMNSSLDTSLDGSSSGSHDTSLTHSEGPGSPGFVPSEELRRSLVDDVALERSITPPFGTPPSSEGSPSPIDFPASTSQQQAGNDQSTRIVKGMGVGIGAAAAAAAAASSVKRSPRIRIDPIGKYFEPVHQPGSPTRQPVKKVLSRRPGDLPITKVDIPPKKPSGQQGSPAGDRAADSSSSLSKILTGRFSFSDLFASFSSASSASSTRSGGGGGGATDLLFGGDSERRRQVSRANERLRREKEREPDDDADDDDVGAEPAEEDLSPNSSFVRALEAAADEEASQPATRPFFSPEHVGQGSLAPLSPFAPPSASGASTTPWNSPRQL